MEACMLGKSDMFVEDGLDEMEKILKRVEVGRIALCDDSKPYIVPVNFFYHEGKIAFHCAWEGKKLDLIDKTPNCCFEVDEFMGEVSYHYEARCHLDYDSVLAFGKARVSECCCVVIDIQELTGRRERTEEGKHKKTMWRHRF
jgi:hypothetical protein